MQGAAGGLDEDAGGTKLHILTCDSAGSLLANTALRPVCLNSSKTEEALLLSSGRGCCPAGIVLRKYWKDKGQTHLTTSIKIRSLLRRCQILAVEALPGNNSDCLVTLRLAEMVQQGRESEQRLPVTAALRSEGDVVHPSLQAGAPAWHSTAASAPLQPGTGSGRATARGGADAETAEGSWQMGLERGSWSKKLTVKEAGAVRALAGMVWDLYCQESREAGWEEEPPAEGLSCTASYAGECTEGLPCTAL